MVGTPVLRAKFCFAFVMPKARFHENERPGMHMGLLVKFLCVMLVVVIRRGGGGCY